MKIRTPKYTTSIIIIGILWAGLIAPATAAAAGKVVHRPISDFLLTQGTYCFGGGPCFLFVPPDANFLAKSRSTITCACAAASSLFVDMPSSLPDP